MKKYKIMYGNRRFEACQKLGMKHIEAKIQGEECSRIIKLDDIEQKTNIRTKMETEDLSSLMASIRDRGLLEPIGICINGSINDENFLLINATENLHREDISPVELGKTCNELHTKYDMSFSEIAVKLNIPITRVEMCVRLFKEVPESFHNLIGSNNNRKKKDGKIKPSIVNSILNFRFSKTQIEKMLIYTKKNDLTHAQLRLIRKLIQQGNSFEQSLKKFNEFKTVSFDFSFHKETLENIKKEWKVKTNHELITMIIGGKVRGKPELVHTF